MEEKNAGRCRSDERSVFGEAGNASGCWSRGFVNGRKQKIPSANALVFLSFPSLPPFLLASPPAFRLPVCPPAGFPKTPRATTPVGPAAASRRPVPPKPSECSWSTRGALRRGGRSCTTSWRCRRGRGLSGAMPWTPWWKCSLVSPGLAPVEPPYLHTRV